MKKWLSLILALLMIFSLALFVGCSSDEENTSGEDVDEPSTNDTSPNNTDSDDADPDSTDEVTEEMLNNSKPNEYIQEKLDAGMEVIFGYAAIADNFFTNQILGEGIRQYVESLGMSYSFQSAAEDVATLITIIENYTQMGAAICTILPPDGSVVQSAVEQAQEKGTTCIIWGTSADYDTVVATYDNSTYGNAIGEMTMAWVNSHFPNAAEGEVKTAFQYQTTVVDVIERRDGVLNVLNANPCISLEYEVDNPTNTGLGI